MSVDIVVIISESSQQVEITLKTNIHHKCWSNIGYCLILSVCSVVCYSGSVKSLSLYKICKRFLKNLLSYPHSCFLCWLMNAGQNSVLKTGRHRDSQTSRTVFRQSQTHRQTVDSLVTTDRWKIQRQVENSNLVSLLVRLIQEKVCVFIP